MPKTRFRSGLRALSVAAGAVMLLAGATQSWAWTQMQTDLDRAIRAGSETQVAALIARADDLDVPVSPSGMTALALAAVRGEAGIVRQLIEAGADVEAADFRGAAPISAAARSCYGTIEVIDLLVDAGADLENRSGAGLTPLLVAIQEERYELAAHLIARGADVNALNMYGDGALNYAIYYRAPDIIELAVDHGAEPDQLRVLFETRGYYYPNFGERRPHAQREVCAD